MLNLTAELAVAKLPQKRPLKRGKDLTLTGFNGSANKNRIKALIVAIENYFSQIAMTQTREQG